MIAAMLSGRTPPPLAPARGLGGQLALLLSALLAGATADAVTLHVAPGGNDANPGASPEKPVQTLAAVKTKLSENASITAVVFAAGSYPGTLFVEPPKGADAANPPPLAIRAAAGAEVIFNGARSIDKADPLAGAPGVFSVRGEYSMAPPPMMWEADTRARYLAAADLATVKESPATFFARDNTLYFHTTDGGEASAHRIGVSQYDVGMFIRRNNTTVQDIRFHNYLLKVWSSAIDIRARMIVRDCAAWNCNWGFLASGASDGAQILNCRAEDCAMGVYVNGKNATVEGCTLLKVRDGFMIPSYPQDDCGIQFYFPAGDGVIRGNVVKGFELGIFMKTGPAKYLVEHNTVVDGHYGITRSAVYEDCAILRNIIVNFFTPIAKFDSIPLDAAVDYNCLWLPRSNDEFFRSMNGPRLSGVGLHDFAADPRFVNPEKNDFRLLPDSPCVALNKPGRPIGALGAVAADFKDTAPPALQVSLLPPAVAAGPSGKMMFERDPWIGGGRSFVRDLVKADDKSGFISPIPQVTLLLNATDAVSGLAKLQWRIGGGEWSKAETFFHRKEVTLPDKDGVHDVAVRVADKAGNWSEAIALPMRLARAKPALAGSPAIYANANGVVVSFQSDAPCLAAIEYGLDPKYGTKIEEAKHVTHNWDGNDGGDYVSTWDEARTLHHIALLAPEVKPDASYHYRLLLRDRVGNEFASADATFKVAGKPRVIHVARGGKDADGRGGEVEPLGSIQFAADRALPGDKVSVGPGLYFGETHLTHGGIKDAPLTIAAAERGTVILDGQRKRTPLRMDHAPYLTVRGLELRWYLFPGAAVFLADSPHFTISDCRIWNDWWSGWPVGFGVFALRSPCLTADRNLIYRQESGLTLLQSPHSQVTFNTMFHNLYNGPNFLFSCDGSTLRNNSLCFNGNDIVGMEELSRTPLESFDSDYNNYGTDLSEYAGGVDKLGPDARAEHFEVKDRCLRSGSKSVALCIVPGVARQRYHSLKEWRAFTNKDKHSIFADPRYVNPQSFDLRLQPGSPNIGAGENGATIGALPAESKAAGAPVSPALPAVAAAAEVALYVAPNGSDANPGTSPAKPIQSLQRVAAALSRTNNIAEVVFAGGTYFGSLIVARVPGTPSEKVQPLTLRAAAGAQTIFDGSVPVGDARPLPDLPGVYAADRPDVNGPWDEFSLWEDDTRARYLRAADLDAVKVAAGSFCPARGRIYLRTTDGRPPDQHRIRMGKHQNGITAPHYLSYAPAVTIRGLRFQNYESSGVEIGKSDSIVADCAARNCERGFAVGATAANVKIQRCSTEDCAGGVYVNGTDALIENCRLVRARDDFIPQVYEQDDTGIQFYYPARNGIARGNLVKGFRQGVFIKTVPGEFLVERNTVIDCGTGLQQTHPNPPNHEPTTFRRNIVWCPDGRPLADPGAGAPGYTVAENCFGPAARIKSAARPEDGNRIADPRFAGLEVGDYRLLQDSPCLSKDGKPWGAFPVVDVAFKPVPPLPTKALVAAESENEPGAGILKTPQPKASAQRKARTFEVWPDRGPALRSVLDDAVPGDRIVLKPGLYVGPIHVLNGGAPDAPLTIESETTGAAVLDGLRKTEHTLRIENAPQVTIKGLEIRWCSPHINSCNVLVQRSPNVALVECKLWNWGWRGGWEQGVGVYVRDSPDFTMRGCLVLRQEMGVALYGSPRARITHNTMLRNLYLATSFNAGSAAGSSQRNNSFCGNGNDIFGLDAWPGSPPAFDSDYNNLGTFLPGSPKEEQLDMQDQLLNESGSKAIVWCPRGDQQRFHTLKAWSEFSGVDSNSIFAAPLYADTRNHDFRLLPGSPNIGKAENAATIGATSKLRQEIVKLAGLDRSALTVWHAQGQATEFTFPDLPLRVADPAGKDISSQAVNARKPGFELPWKVFDRAYVVIDSRNPSGAYRIAAAAATGPAWFETSARTKWSAGIPCEISSARSNFTFAVPKGMSRFSIRVSGAEALMLKSPNGGTRSGKGPAWVVDLPEGDGGIYELSRNGTGEAAVALDEMMTKLERFNRTPLLVWHEQGRPTYCRFSGVDLRVDDPGGKDVSSQTCAGNLVTVAADSPPGAYRIAPRQEPANGWAPFIPASFDTSGGARWMLAIPAGISYTQPSVFFIVPPGARRFAIKTLSAPNTQPKLRLVLPNGKTLAGAARTWNVDVPEGGSGVCELAREDTQEKFLALEGIPAFVTFRKDAAHAVTSSLTADSPTNANAAWLPGAFPNTAGNLALHVAGTYQTWSIPLGRLQSPGRRERFDAARGTFEFRVKCLGPPDFADNANAGGIPMFIKLDDSVKGGDWMRNALDFWMKNGILMGDGERNVHLASLGPWSYGVGPALLDLNRWAHIAVVWQRADNRFTGQVFLNGAPALPAPLEFAPLKIVPPGDCLVIQSHNHNLALDELRISDTVRYDMKSSFEPPSGPFEKDANTLLLLHFDGALTAAGRSSLSRPFAFDFDKFILDARSIGRA